MTARTIYDIYDLNAPFVSPTAPAPAATTQGPAVEQSARDRMPVKNLLTWLGLLALVPLLIGEIYYTEIIFDGAVDAATLAWLLVIAVGNIAAGIFILLALRANDGVQRVTA